MALGAMAAALGLTSCYGHLRPEAVSEAASGGTASGPGRPALPAPRTGVYAVEGPDGVSGAERFTVTATGGLWRLRSRRTVGSLEEGFGLDVDAASAEPVAFEVWRRFEDVRHALRGERVGGWFEVRRTGLGPPVDAKVPYARGTTIDAASPTFKAVVLALLGPSLERGTPVAVRTIRVDGLRLRARVLLSRFERRGSAGGLALVRLLRSGEAPGGLWVQSDGWPARMRVLGRDRRPHWRWRLTTSTAAAAAGARAPP